MRGKRDARASLARKIFPCTCVGAEVRGDKTDSSLDAIMTLTLVCRSVAQLLESLERF